MTGRRLIRERPGDYIAGCMLYWAEGAKARNTAKVFARFLRRHFDVPDEKMSVYKLREPEILDLSLLADVIRKGVAVHPHGTTALVVNSTQIVQPIYGSIQEYGGFERPEWLD